MSQDSGRGHTLADVIQPLPAGALSGSPADPGDPFYQLGVYADRLLANERDPDIELVRWFAPAFRYEHDLPGGRGPKVRHLYAQALPSFAPTKQLENGADFPERCFVIAMVDDGPVLTITLGVWDGKPALLALGISPTVDGKGNPTGPVLAGQLRELPVDTVLADAIKAAVRGHAQYQDTRRRLSASDVKRMENKALKGRRGRIRTEDLARVADILRTNDYDWQKEVARELGVSERQAARYIAEVRRRKKDQAQPQHTLDERGETS